MDYANLHEKHSLPRAGKRKQILQILLCLGGNETNLGHTRNEERLPCVFCNSLRGELEKAEVRSLSRSFTSHLAYRLPNARWPV